MKILTVSASPYLLVRNGRMNAAIIKKLRSEGHEVSTAAWHHDEGFFLPEEGGAHWYEINGENAAPIIPFEPQAQGSGALYEIMKQVHPDVVISIGDYKETDFIWDIKAMYPNLFKWIAVMCVDCLYVNEQHKSNIEYADKVISVNNFGMVTLNGLCNIDAEMIPFGIKQDVFTDEGRVKGENTTVLCSAKNAQASNVAAFISTMGQIQGLLELTEQDDELVGKLHTNLYDPGDYELELLIERYGAKNVSLPDKFVSVKDSISDEEMADEYRSADFFVDCSVKCATALGMLEAMACGCVPIGMDIGRVGEILREMPEEYRLVVPHETFIGAREEEFSVISIEGLRDVLLNIRERSKTDPAWLKAAQQAAKEISQKYAEEAFVDRLVGVIEEVKAVGDKIAVESF